jgi:phage FluMu protein gp41
LPQYIQFALLQRGVETAGDIADLTPFVWKQMKQLKESDQTLVAEKLKELGLRIKK